MDTIGTFFRLPEGWGRNWDAFCDSIQDSEISTLPSQFQIIGLANLQKNLGEDARIFEEILNENRIAYTILASSSKK